MIWLGWRQQRAETLVTAAILAALAALLVPTGLMMASAYDHAGLAHCLGHTDGGGTCGAAVDDFFSRFANLGDPVDCVTIIPVLVGVLLAAPFVLQLEQRTYRLDWTQGITRGAGSRASSGSPSREPRLRAVPAGRVPPGEPLLAAAAHRDGDARRCGRRADRAGRVVAAAR